MVMMDGTIVRAGFKPIELATLNDGINCLIDELKEQLKEDPANEELDWHLTCALRMRFRIERSVNKLRGSEPIGIMHKALARNREEEDYWNGEFIDFWDAISLIPVAGNVWSSRRVTILLAALKHGTVRGHISKENTWVAKEKDVLRMAKYLEVFV